MTKYSFCCSCLWIQTYVTFVSVSFLKYGNVSFICTQTDDCEATEIMRDHQDVAVLKPGRWERMTELRDKIMSIEKDYADLVQEEEDLKIDYEEADMSAKDAKEELEEEQKESMEVDDGEEAEVDVELLEQLQKTVDEKAEAAKQALVLLKSWQAQHQEQMQRMQDAIRKLQRRLKAICATVRNEYSTSCLQEDFRAGLKELCRKPDDEEAEGLQQENATTNTPLPDDFNMDVYCISGKFGIFLRGSWMSCCPCFHSFLTPTFRYSSLLYSQPTTTSRLRVSSLPAMVLRVHSQRRVIRRFRVSALLSTRRLPSTVRALRPRSLIPPATWWIESNCLLRMLPTYRVAVRLVGANLFLNLKWQKWRPRSSLLQKIFVARARHESILLSRQP